MPAHKKQTPPINYITMTQSDGAAFWSSLGPLACDPSVAKEIGSPVVSTERHTWVFAVDGDEVVGCGAFVLPKTAGEPAWIDMAYVRPSHRWQGIWRDLFARRMELANAAGIATLRVCTRVLAARLEREGFATYQQRGSWSYMQRPALIAL